MIVVFTAANSFLARRLAPVLVASGHTVRGTLRRQQQAPDLRWLQRYAVADLAQPDVGDLFSGADAVVHLAHDFTPGASSLNVAGTLAFFDQAAKAGVKQQIFVSSYSARPDAISEYGRCKFALEEPIRSRGGVVVRPGLVLGGGGIYARMVRAIERLPIVPVPSGKGRIPFISTDQLGLALQTLLAQPIWPTDTFNLFAPELATLTQLLHCSRAAMHARTIFIPVPAGAVRIALRLAEKLRLPLPVTADNFDGFIGNQIQVHHANMHLLGIEPETLRQAVELAIAQRDKKSWVS